MTTTVGRFRSKVILVTGGSSGMGHAAASRMAAEGAAVVIAARRSDVGEAAAESPRAAGGRALFVQADLTIEDQAAAAVRAAVESFGRLDGAFNNTGGVAAAAPVADVTAEAWAAELALNLTSVFWCLKHEVTAIAASGGGAIVNNASVAGGVGVAGMSAYAAAKHGVVGLTRSAALEWADRGVRINALLTGNVDTPLFRRLLGVSEEADLDGAGLNPTGRVAQPAEIAALRGIPAQRRGPLRHRGDAAHRRRIQRRLRGMPWVCRVGESAHPRRAGVRWAAPTRGP